MTEEQMDELQMYFQIYIKWDLIRDESLTDFEKLFLGQWCGSMDFIAYSIDEWSYLYNVTDDKIKDVLKSLEEKEYIQIKKDRMNYIVTPMKVMR